MKLGVITNTTKAVEFLFLYPNDFKGYFLFIVQ